MNPTTPDRTVVQTVIIFLGLLGIAALGSGTYLLDQGRPAGDVAIVFGIATACTGALGAILASTRTAAAGVSVQAPVTLLPSDAPDSAVLADPGSAAPSGAQQPAPVPAGAQGAVEVVPGS